MSPTFCEKILKINLLPVTHKWVIKELKAILCARLKWQAQEGTASGKKREIQKGDSSFWDFIVTMIKKIKKNKC